MQLPDLSRHDTTAKVLLHNAAHWGAEVVLREKEYGIWKVYTWADTRARVEELMRAADIFTLGSHREGSGYALTEALACGLPPVVTDIP